MTEQYGTHLSYACISLNRLKTTKFVDDLYSFLFIINFILIALKIYVL